MNSELIESPHKFESFPTTKTEKVLEKWSTEGEIKKETIRKAANQYAKLEINNRILKWIIVVVVTFLFVLLGFMIASVVIGVNITKEVTVKNGQLVSTSGNNSVVKTSTVKYHNKITLNSPSSVIDSLTSITVSVSDGLYEGILQFDVVSYVFIPGKKLTFYGHSHQAEVKPDGTVKLINLLGNKRDEGSSSGTGVSGTSGDNGSSNLVHITTCSELANIQTTGSYAIDNELECNNLQLPLLSGQVFTGILDGQGNRLKINFASTTSKVALFDTIGEHGSVNGIILEGSLSGVGQCAGFAIKALTGSYFSKNSNYATITCQSGSNNQAGSFFAQVEAGTSTDNIVIDKSVAQAKIIFNDNTAIVGGFYAKSNSQSSIVTFTYSAADTINLSTTGTKTHFGILNGTQEHCPGGDNYIVVDVGETSTTLQCAYPIERCPNNPDYFNCDSTFCYACRDKASRNTAKRNLELRKTPDNIQITPNFPKDVCY